MAAVYERGGEWHAVPKPVPLSQVVRSALLNALAYTNGEQAQAAALLAMSARQMTYQLHVHHIPTARQPATVGVKRPPRLGRHHDHPRLVAARRRA